LIAKRVFRRLPESPGVYIFRDGNANVLYVGKAINLKKRVEQHYSGAPLDYREEFLREHAEKVEVFKTRNETEALILENNLIKRYKPELNVMLKDDKSYPYIKLTKELYPRVVLTRRLMSDGALYFGPYTNVAAARLTIKELRRAFPVRTCALTLDDKKVYRPCIDYHIKLCNAPCAGLITRHEYQNNVKGFAAVLKGSYKRALAGLYNEMQQSSKVMRYETAAAFRDRIMALEKLQTKQYVQLPGWAEFDVVAAQADSGVVLHFRRGALVGREVLKLKVPAGLGEGKLLSEFIQLYYSSGRSPGETVLCAVEPEDLSALQVWLKTKNHRAKIRMPRNKLESALVTMCSANLPPSYTFAAQDLAKQLELSCPPRVIQGFDVSNLGSANPYVSAVCFVDGSPFRRAYRVYGIKGVKGQNDFAMIREAVFRHFRHVRKNEVPRPDLILIDGGQAQLRYARQALILSHEAEQAVVSLAKREELIHTVSGRVISLDRSSAALQLLQRVRDESHRFALAHHRHKRRQQSLVSVLNGIKGLGRARLTALALRYPTVSQLRQASPDDLNKVPGISELLAARISEKVAQFGQSRLNTQKFGG
jgi:excinuclease ABC subunit C